MNSKEQIHHTVAVLRLTLHDRLIGYLAGFSNGRNSLHFADELKNDPLRPTFSLITHPDFPRAQQLMAQPWVTRQRLHPTLSNLLPEGVLRELIAQGLKTHIDNEFEIFSSLGQDLPGAIIATPLKPAEIPEGLLTNHSRIKEIPLPEDNRQNTFSLAGVQMKFSMKEKDGRYNLSNSGNLGDSTPLAGPLSIRHCGHACYHRLQTQVSQNPTSASATLRDWLFTMGQKR